MFFDIDDRPKAILRIVIILLTCASLPAIAPAADVVAQPIRQYGAGVVNSIAMSRDGSVAALGGTNAQLIDMTSGTVLRTFFGHQDVVYSVAISSDTAKLLTGSRDGTARLWDLNTGESLFTFTGHNDQVKAVAFTPDGSQFVTGAAFYDGTAKLWNLDSNSPVRIFAGHTMGVNAVAVSPDGQRLLTGSDDKTAKLWDLENGDELRSFSHPDSVYAVTFAPDPETVYTGCADGLVRGFRASTGDPINGYGNQLSAFAISANGERIVTGDIFGWVTVRNFPQGNLKTYSKGSRKTTALAISPDGKRVLAALLNGPVELFDAATGASIRLLGGHGDTINSAIFTPDGSRIATGSRDESAQVWDRQSGLFNRRFSSSPNDVYDLAVSPDNTRLLTAAASAKEWNLGTGALVRTYLPGPVVSDVSYSMDGVWVLLSGSGMRPSLCETQTGFFIRQFGDSPVNGLAALSPDKTQVAASRSTRVIVWNTATGAEELSLPTGTTNGLAFSPDGKRILTGGMPGTNLRLWSSRTGELLRTLSAPLGFNEYIFSVAYSPDGSRVLAGFNHGKTRLWNAYSGELLRTFDHPFYTSSVAFSPDGKQILTASRDVAMTWDISDIPLPVLAVADWALYD